MTNFHLKKRLAASIQHHPRCWRLFSVAQPFTAGKTIPEFVRWPLQGRRWLKPRMVNPVNGVMGSGGRVATPA